MSSDIEKEPLSRQQKKSKETKARIFHAAKTILQKQGYDQLSIKNICDEAGVSNGSFYHHFKTKDDLLSYYIEEQPSINPDLLDTPEDADEAKIGIIHVYLNYAQYCRELGVEFMSNYYTPRNQAVFDIALFHEGAVDALRPLFDCSIEFTGGLDVARAGEEKILK